MEETKEWLADCLMNEEDDMHDQRDDFGKRISRDESCGRSKNNPVTPALASSKFGKEVNSGNSVNENEEFTETDANVCAVSNDRIVNEGGNFDLENNMGFNDCALNEGCMGSVKKSVERKLKRKKDSIKKVVGLSPVEGYISSNDRPVKEVKVSDEDPFGLDPLINGLDFNVQNTRGFGDIPLCNSFEGLIDESSEEVPVENGVDGSLPLEMENVAGKQDEVREWSIEQEEHAISIVDVDKKVTDTLAFGEKRG
ncbi:hypothetical protein Hanom_Chr02g00134061 [Helianthus anomalus]